MRKVINILSFCVFYLIGIISSRLNIRMRNRFGRLLGFLLMTLGPKRKKITLANLRLAYPNELELWHKKILRESYYNLGITLAELVSFKYLKREDIYRYIQIDNLKAFKDAIAKGKGVIVMSGHYGNWELLAYAAGFYTDTSILIVVHHQHNELADKFLNRYRTLGGNRVIDMRKSAKEIVKTIRQGGVVALLADQAATFDKDLWVEFFGYPSATFEAPASIALRFNVPVFMGFCERNEDLTYTVRIEEIKHDDLTFSTEGVLELTKRHVRSLENAIRRYPGLWAWQHRKWKHTDYIKY
jgi:KDO2-lipid IV(A) lauroyltransferase